jgi:hypothetical protein
MITLNVVNKPVINATAAPTTPKARHNGAMSKVEKVINSPVSKSNSAPQIEGQS